MMNEIARFSRITGPIPDCIGSTPRARCMTNAAPISPNTAPEAPTVTAFGDRSSAPKEPDTSDVR